MLMTAFSLFRLSANTLFYFVVANIQSLLAKLSKLGKSTELFGDGEKKGEGVHLTHAEGSCVFSCNSLPAAAVLCLKHHYVLNVHYKKAMKAFYGVLEALLGIPVTVTLGVHANKYLQMFKEQ
jgi:hypothetical protein